MLSDWPAPVSAGSHPFDQTIAKSANDISLTSVGQIGRLKQVVLPGGQLQARPIDDRQLSVIVRITNSWPHGTDFRYDIEYMGLEPGEFDLRDFLVRSDGTATDDLPSIPVIVQSVLPAGHIPPSELESRLPRLGSYRLWLLLAATAWLAGLLWLIFHRPTAIVNQVATESPPLTLAQLLNPRLQAAAAGELNTQQLAELERYLVEFWRRKLGWEQDDWTAALPRLRRHETAGPLLLQVEKWLHAPPTENPIDLADLLKPYQNEWVSS